MEKTPRSAFEVIDQAIEENRLGEYVAYFIILVAVGGGMFAMVQAYITNNPLWAGAGAIPALFLWPALNATTKIRQQNKAIRLLELPLSRAETAQQAAAMLQAFFETTFDVKR